MSLYYIMVTVMTTHFIASISIMARQSLHLNVSINSIKYVVRFKLDCKWYHHVHLKLYDVVLYNSW